MEYVIKSIQALSVANRWDYKFHQRRFTDLANELAESSYPLQTIKDVTTQVIDGTHYTPQYTDSSGVLFLMARNVRPFEINLNQVAYISREEHQRIIRCKPEPGDVLVTKDGTIGVAAVVPTHLPEFNIFVSLMKLRPKSTVSPHYLAAFINSKLGQLQIEQQIKGSSIIHIHLEDIKRIKIPIPPLPIQERIAKVMQDANEERRKLHLEVRRFLDGVDGAVLQHLGINLNGLSQERRFLSSISQLGRWDITYNLPYYAELERVTQKSPYTVKALRNVVDFSKDVINPSKTPDKLIDYIEIGNVDAKFWEVSSVNRILGKDTPSRARRLVKAGDIVTAISGVLTGTKRQSTFIVPEHLDGAVVSTGFAVIRPKKGFLPEYIFSLLVSGFFSEMIWRRKTGAAIPAISVSDLMAIPTPCPPIKVQERIASEILFRKQQALVLQSKADSILSEAKVMTERMILGEEDKEKVA
jgi:type I restriction enzyme, S subunit